MKVKTHKRIKIFDSFKTNVLTFCIFCDELIVNNMFKDETFTHIL
jgi:hypothetical protein